MTSKKRIPFEEYKRLSWKYSEAFISDVQFKEYHAFRKRREREELSHIMKQLDGFMHAEQNEGCRMWSLEIREHEDSTILDIGRIAYLKFVYSDLDWADSLALISWRVEVVLSKIKPSSLSYIYDFGKHFVFRYREILRTVDMIDRRLQIYDDAPFRYGKFYANALEKYGYKVTVGRTRLTIQYSEDDTPLSLGYMGKAKFCTASDERLHLVFAPDTIIEMMELITRLKELSMQSKYTNPRLFLFKGSSVPIRKVRGVRKPGFGKRSDRENE